MKVLVALALNLAWCALAASQCVMIPDRKPSSRNAKITGWLDGKPQANAELFIKAEIQIYQRGSYPRETVMTVKTDDQGRFSASLEPGVYTVIVRSLDSGPSFKALQFPWVGKTMNCGSYSGCRHL